MFDLMRPAMRNATSSSRRTRSSAAFLRRIATRVSKSGGWMSAMRPHSKRERSRSSISGMFFGEQEIDGTIAGSELGGAVVPDGVDELVGEALRGQVHDGHARKEPAGLMPDGVQQVRLAETDATIDEEWVVG